MNETLKVIRDRRSIRAFRDEQLKPDEVDAIVDAGLYAPSASNAQNLRYTIIQNKGLIERTAKWVVDEIDRIGNEYLKQLVARTGGHIFRNAPTVFIISSETKDRFGIVNAAAAIENMLLAAESLGIGSCWIGMLAVLAGSPRVNEYAAELQIPEGFSPQFGVTFGYKVSANPEAPVRNRDIISYIR
jgi:nitroreductase